MKPRHVAALALVGWYLMVPPSSCFRKGPNVDAPISGWHVKKSFETAIQCESDRFDMRQVWVPNPNPKPKPTKVPDLGEKRKKTLSEWEAERRVSLDLQGHYVPANPFALAAQCIATDDPRLAK